MTTEGPGKTKPKIKKTKTRPMEEVPGAEPRWLRERTDRRRESRYTPASNLPAVLGVLVSSGGAVLTGAGFFSQVIRKPGPHPYGLYLLLGGLVLFLIGLYISTRVVPTFRIGDAGIAVEGRSSIERIAWYEIEGITVENGQLAFRGEGKVIKIPVSDHPTAYAQAVTEARARVPGKSKRIPGEVKAPNPTGADQLVLPPPQLAGLHCKASDELIAFENDARLCGRCGETYHKNTVPPRCLTCDARLL